MSSLTPAEVWMLLHRAMDALPQGSLVKALEDEGLWDSIKAAAQLCQEATRRLFVSLAIHGHSASLAPLLTGLDKSFLLESSWL